MQSLTRIGDKAFAEFIHSNSTLDPVASQELWVSLRCMMRKALIEGRTLTVKNVLTARPYDKPEFTYVHPITGKTKTSKARRNVKMSLAFSLTQEFKVAKGR